MPLDEDPNDAEAIAARARQAQDHANATCTAECNRRLRELGPENPDEAGYRVAAELDGLRRTPRGDVCDMILSAEWDGRRV